VVKKPDVVNLWKKHVQSRKASVKLFQGKVVKVLLKFRTKTLAKLDHIHLQDGLKSLTDTTVQRSLVDLIFDKHSFSEDLWASLDVPIRSLLQSAGDEARDEVGVDDPWKYPSKAMLEYLAGRKVNVQGCGSTVRNQLNTSLSEGVTNGETHLELAARVKQVFGDLTDGQAKTIAMTEVNIGYNTSRHQAMVDAGIEYKAWLSSHGPNVREAHSQAEEDYIDNPIPMDEPFEVMEEQLMFPGDDSLGASLENIINCQCVQLAAMKKSEDEKTITYLIHGLGLIVFKKL
jgi:hypothetical protein